MSDMSELTGQNKFLGDKQTEAAETATFTSRMEVFTIPTSLALSGVNYATTKSFKSLGLERKDRNSRTTKDGTT